MSWNDILMRPPQIMLEDMLAAYSEEFPMILGELDSLSKDRPILAEGNELLPELVGEYVNRRRAVWIVPSEEFQTQAISDT
jgi:hypothetical protein